MKILVPVDGSEQALGAVRHALRLCQEGLNASSVLATVQEPTYLYEMVLAPDADVLERVTGAVGSRAPAGAERLLMATNVSQATGRERPEPQYGSRSLDQREPGLGVIAKHSESSTEVSLLKTIIVKQADRPDSVRRNPFRGPAVTAIPLGRRSPTRLGATYPHTPRDQVIVCLLGIAARRDCPFHLMRGRGPA